MAAGLALLGMALAGASLGPPLEVTGRPASAGFLASVAGLPVGGDLAPGQRRRVDGLEIRNLALPDLPVQALAFSDHPERVRSRGLLFQGGLLEFKPVRFQYYHEGGRPGGDLYLALRLANLGREPARVHWIGAAAGPDPDYFVAGHLDNRRFMERLAAFEGHVEGLDPGEVRQVALHPLPVDQVVSGTAQMTLLEGSGVGYGLFAVQAPEEPVGFDLLSHPKDVHARGVYPAADQDLVRSWTVGEEEGYAAFGAVRQPNVLAGPELKGDYGVVYRLRMVLRNPAPEAAEVEVLFNPRGGKATGTFLLVDPEAAGPRWLEAGTTEAMARVPLATVRLGARQAKTLEIWTMPEGASNYPVRLVFRKAA